MELKKGYIMPLVKLREIRPYHLFTINNIDDIYIKVSSYKDSLVVCVRLSDSMSLSLFDDLEVTPVTIFYVETTFTSIQETNPVPSIGPFS